jgi:hypothetical protein
MPQYCRTVRFEPWWQPTQALSVMPPMNVPLGRSLATLRIWCDSTWARSGAAIASGLNGSSFGTLGSVDRDRPSSEYRMWQTVQPEERKSAYRLFAPLDPAWQSPHWKTTVSITTSWSGESLTTWLT